MTGVLTSWPGACLYDVTLTSGASLRALAYTDVVGELLVGDVVLLNTTALDAGLGTGGVALVVAVPDRLPDTAGSGPGHLVKARYTPLQTMVLGADEPDSPHHGVLREASDLGGLPVIVADLHSALPAIVAGLRAERPQARVAYVMTDGGALPLAFSRTVAALRSHDWLVGCVTVGQAYGGDLEAVTVHSGLLAARHVLGADVAVVTQGPGNLGTDTPWGFSGVGAGEALNAAVTLGGVGVASLRVSQADARDRHRGISHHSVTAYGLVALVTADIPVPLLDGPIGLQVLREAKELTAASDGRLRLHEIDVDGLDSVLRECPVPLRTMGRSYDEDRAGFLAVAAAGRFVGRALPASPPAA